MNVYEKFTKFVADAQKNTRSVNELSELIVFRQRRIWQAFYRHYGIRPRKNKRTYLESVYLYVQATTSAENKHVAPAGQKIENWNNTKGFPAYEGWLSVQYTSRYSNFDMVFFDKLRIHTHNPITTALGNGKRRLTARVTIFTDDWTGLREQMVLDKLKGDV